ncbi:hypothetical protein Fmac_025335 [Flemingia macrophylla]|uniref:Uncharacterized protein n=1 Tax=Flemingia macrophylla TaxID=520843 RepID=A0ABD1LRW9_9FABA
MEENETFIYIIPMFYIYDLTTFTTRFFTSGSTNVITSKFEMHNMLFIIERFDIDSVVLILSSNSIHFPVVYLATMSLSSIITTTNPLNTLTKSPSRSLTPTFALPSQSPPFIPKITTTFPFPPYRPYGPHPPPLHHHPPHFNILTTRDGERTHAHTCERACGVG